MCSKYVYDTFIPTGYNKKQNHNIIITNQTYKI